MRSAYIIGLCLLSASGVYAQGKAEALLRSGKAAAGTSPASASQSLTEFRSRRYTNLVYSGAMVQVVKGVNPLQLISPFAPARFGAVNTNTVGRGTLLPGQGVKLVSLSF